MCSSSTPKPAVTSGPSGSISGWPISSTCRRNRRGRRSILRLCSQANDQHNYELKVIREPVKERRSFVGISAFMVS